MNALCDERRVGQGGDRLSDADEHATGAAPSLGTNTKSGSSASQVLPQFLQSSTKETTLWSAGKAGQSAGHHTPGCTKVTVLRIGALRELTEELARHSQPRDGEDIGSGSDVVGSCRVTAKHVDHSLTLRNESDQSTGSWRTLGDCALLPSRKDTAALKLRETLV